MFDRNKKKIRPLSPTCFYVEKFYSIHIRRLVKYSNHAFRINPNTSTKYTDRKGMANSAIYILWFWYNRIYYGKFSVVLFWTQITTCTLRNLPYFFYHCSYFHESLSWFVALDLLYFLFLFFREHSFTLGLPAWRKESCSSLTSAGGWSQLSHQI
jgi:hypothetical protein